MYRVTFTEISEANDAESSKNKQAKGSDSKVQTETVTQQYGNNTSEVLTDPDSSGEGCSSGVQGVLSSIECT
jgi:hypothetical protein